MKSINIFSQRYKAALLSKKITVSIYSGIVQTIYNLFEKYNSQNFFSDYINDVMSELRIYQPSNKEINGVSILEVSLRDFMYYGYPSNSLDAIEVFSTLIENNEFVKDINNLFYNNELPYELINNETDITENKTEQIFDNDIVEIPISDVEMIAKRVRELAFLNKGITIDLIDENEVEELGNQKRSYNYTEGLKEFIRFINEKNSALYKEPIYIEAKTGLVELACAIQHVDLYSENVFSYVNNIPTPEGGMHETGLKSGITRAFNEIARNMNLLKEKDANLLGEDYREGMSVILSIKMKNVQFEGQTKTKLGNPEARAEVENIIYDGLMNYANQTSSKTALTDIINKAKGAAKARDAARKAKEITRAKNSVDTYSLVGKLSSCTGRNPLLNEVFIVEGDSAGGSAKQARDRSFQAILPLRGKPLNVEKKRISQVLENEEIRTIISAVGTGIGTDFNIENLKYNKIIIMADADQDGAHIRAILLTFFYRYMRELINTGHVYVAIAPLYKIYKKGFEKYVYNEEDYDDIVKEAGAGYSVTRFKGLGEMSAEQLWDTTMNPAKRVLVKVTIDDLADAEEMIATLMGDNIDARKKYITANANFNKVDAFEARSLKK